MVRVIPEAVALSFTGAGLLAEAVGVSAQVSTIGRSIDASDYVHHHVPGDKLIDTFIENV